ncbi:MAG: winged helix-turn-helix domain-containing protein [Endomicrobia bacterium]|nr:winged helix-turn-helix domain-containing protein [Endomicrobiia bacterium]MCX7941176.1 winged helix-turn-helix domain-containing protein [Endomicrobiia bacterium]MDW8056208.1 winged helix-turn-helix domain-containing protein [Elusimicrobiota bacterium]
MNKIEEIGLNAGKIWTYLNNKKDFAEVLEIKFQLKLSNTDLFLALGWLAREDKLVFLFQDGKLRVKLK